MSPSQPAPWRIRPTAGGVPPALPRAAIAPDCRHYRGDRPCLHNRLCTDCPHYAPHSARLCIIKLGALGDVIRTLCLLPELRRQYPEAHITWVSLPAGCRMIQRHPLLDRVLPFDPVTLLMLQQESFDAVISLDKEPQPCAFANALFAKRKLGIGLSEHGTPVPLNPEAHGYFHLGLSDELKFRANRKSYPQLVYEALGLVYQGQRYELPVDEARRDRIRLHLAERGWRPGVPTLGINLGAGPVFANKMWPAERIVDLIRQLRKRQPAWQIVLLGGPDEQPIVARVLADLEEAGIGAGVIDAGTEHDEPSFVAVVDACDAVFTGDTMALHVAIALGKGVVAFFGPTCEQEIDLFGRGEKLVACTPCGPCYKRVCDQGDACLEAIATDDAVAALARVMGLVRAGAAIPETRTLRRAG